MGFGTTIRRSMGLRIFKRWRLPVQALPKACCRPILRSRFPNHLSLVTGLYPEHHGIVANSFYDPAREDTYVYTQSKTNGDGSWYSGTPLWSLAEQQGMRSACFFWPGSEAEIAGKRPSYYLKFDNKIDDTKRVEQVLAWLALPPEQRPHFITLYYANVDHEGHEHGPDFRRGARCSASC